MRKKIIVVVIILLVIIGIFYKFNDLLVPLIFRNEQVGIYELKKMQECKNSEERIITLNFNDFQVTLPLPRGAVEFKNEIYPNDNQYLVSTKYGELENYINNILPTSGFSTERLGAMVYIKDNKNDINVTMSIDMYTSKFMRLNYSIENIVKNGDDENMKATSSTVAIDSEVSDKYKPLENLGNEENDFNIPSFIENKYYIVLENNTVYNKSELDKFIKNINSNIPDQIRTFQMESDGKIIIKDVIFTVDKFIVKDDNRWNINVETENRKIITNEYDVKTYELVKENMQYASNNLETYYKINLVPNNKLNSIYLCDYIENKVNNEYNFELEFTEDLTKGREIILSKSEGTKYDYDIYSYNGTVNIIIDGEKLTLRDALLTNKITMEQILEKVSDDVNIYKTAYKIAAFADGGSTEYLYENYTILKFNVQGLTQSKPIEVYNKDLYIGNLAMTISEIKELYYVQRP